MQKIKKITPNDEKCKNPLFIDFSINNLTNKQLQKNTLNQNTKDESNVLYVDFQFITKTNLKKIKNISLKSTIFEKKNISLQIKTIEK